MTKRIGIIDFDTSHAFAFASRLNHKGVDQDQWVDGAQVVVGCPGKSIIYPELVSQYTDEIRAVGIPIVETPDQMLEYNLDAVLIESNCGSQHLERVEFFARHKVPMFVDKPFACSTADAVRMINLADDAGVPLMSASSLRYAPEVVGYLNRRSDGDIPIVGAITFGPGTLHDKNPGMLNYGIHAVEMLYTLLGPGCESIGCVSSRHADLATGVWRDGRIGSVRADRPARGYGFVTFTDKIEHVAVSTQYIYRELLKAIVGMIETGKSPIPARETLEIIQFIELAKDSASNHGIPRALPNHSPA